MPHFPPFVLLLILLPLSSLIHAGLYKSLGPDGETVYTDFPVSGSTEINPSDLPQLSTYNPRDLPASLTAPQTTPQPEPSNQTTLANYSHFSIIAPTNQATLNNNAETTPRLNLALAPSLKVEAGHFIQLSVNGSRQAPHYTTLELELPQLNRGENLIRASVIDPTGKELIATPVITLHVQQTSTLHKPSTVGKPPQKQPRTNFQAAPATPTYTPNYTQTPPAVKPNHSKTQATPQKQTRSASHPAH